MNSLDYLLKANLYLLLFYSCYWLFLRHTTFFALNRAYLLASVVVSLLLPLAKLPSQAADVLPVPVGVIALPTAMVIAPDASTVDLSQPVLDWQQTGLTVYGLIAFILLLRLLARLVGLLQLIQHSPKSVQGDYVLVRPNDERTPTFSFFRYLVLNPADAQSCLIIRHELVHIRQWHSVDVLVLQLLRAVFWACPGFWLFDRALRQVHEFLADQVVDQPATYAQFLVDYTFGVRPNRLTNGFFNPSLLKQRLTMLGQRATSRWALGKYTLVLPMALGLLAMTTAREGVEAVVDRVINETITISGSVTAADGKPLLGALIGIRGTQRGTSTDLQGNYIITAPTDGTLIVSHKGYETNEVSIKGRQAINVTMAPKLANTIKKSAPKGRASIRTNEPANGNGSKAQSLGELIALDTGGVSIPARIRGVRSLGVGESLYIVDGVEASPDSIKSLESKNIETVTVLKDWSATATYGPKAQYGAVIITTKKP